MQNLGKTETTANRLDIVWHCVLVSLLLLVIINFFYLRHRLIERIEYELEVLELVFQTVPAKQKIHRNLDRWHDSSLIFVAIKDFQAENNNSLPKRWDNALLGSQKEFLAEDKHTVTIQDADYKNLPADRFADLPNEENFHIWPGRICADNQQENYWENTGELTYSQILQEGSNSDFAIVYGAEEPYSTPGILIYGKCLDSQHGPDGPAFIFKQIEPY